MTSLPVFRQTFGYSTLPRRKAKIMYLSTVFAVHPSLAATHLEITKLKVSEEKVQYRLDI